MWKAFSWYKISPAGEHDAAAENRKELQDKLEVHLAVENKAFATNCSAVNWRNLFSVVLCACRRLLTPAACLKGWTKEKWERYNGW